MIEFTGFISGVAEKFYFKEARKNTLKILFITLIILLPVAIFIAIKMQNWMIVGIPPIGLLLFYIILCIVPQSKNEKKKILPKKISIQDDMISFDIEGYPDSRYISDVKEVIDYGEFYQLVLPTGRINISHICQKNLITKGTTEDFEELFKEKLIRKSL